MDNGNGMRKLRELTDRLPPLSKLVVSKASDFVEYLGEGTGVNAVGFGLYKNDRIALQRTYFPQGFTLPAHKHDEREWMIVFSGKLSVLYEDRETILLPGDYICFDKHQAHCITAMDNTWVIGITVPADQSYPEV